MQNINIDDLVDYKKEYSKHLKQVKISNKELISLCPFHKEKNNSFSVDLKTGRYKCFSCKEEGNYINFISKINNVDTKKAYKKILTELGVSQEKTTHKLYRLEDYAKQKQLPIEYLENEWKLKNKKKGGIEIPYFGESGKIVSTRYRLDVKKFAWYTGNKTQLYGKQKIDKIYKAGKVVLVEGESDTQTLWFHGIEAIGVPGASTVQPEWLKILSNVDIYIHHEGDNGADIFLKSVCKALNEIGYKGNVYKIQCMTMGVKDPSELHVKDEASFADNWNRILEKKEQIDYSSIGENLPEILAGSGLYYECPLDFKIDKNGIYKETREGLIKCFCATPILINRALIHMDNSDEKVELKYYTRGRWKTIICSRNIILNDYSVMQLVDLGISITKQNAKYLSMFLWELESLNKKRIPIVSYADQMGWYEDKFLPIDKEDITIYTTDGTNKWISAYSESGIYEEWVNKVRKYRKNNIFRFLLATAFASPLLEILKHRIFFVHNWADSRSGKTACLKAGLSIWGNPDGLMTSFNATKVGLERMAGLFRDLPLGIDEKQVSGKGQEFIDSMVYMLGLGTSKLRGNKTGGIQGSTSWKSIILTTGEEPITSLTSNTGVASRVIEIKGTPFDSEEDARECHEFLNESYGTAGKVFILKLKEYIKLNKDVLKTEYGEIKALFTGVLGDKLGSHITAGSVITLADRLSSKWIFGEPEDDEAFNNSYKILKDLEGIKSTDLVENAYEHMVSWCISNSGSFTNGISYIDNKIKVEYGVVERNNNDLYYCIYPNVFDDELKRQGYSVKAVKDGFANRGYTKGNGDSKLSYVKRINGDPVRTIALKIDKNKLECYDK